VRAARALLAALALGACATTGDLERDRERLLAPSDDAYALAASLVTEVGPRFAGTDGDARAVQWALRRLTELGFSNVRAEPVTVPRWERGAITVEIDRPHAVALDAVALGGSVATPPGGVDGSVVEVRSMAELEALPDAQVSGRIVFINGRMERTRDGSGYGAAAPIRRNGPAVAGRKGARAVLIRSLGTAEQAHTGTTKYEDGPKVPAAALSVPAADALEQVLASGPVRVRLSLAARERPDAQSANVVGEILGQTGDIVLLGAHLDSWDITPGANDDAAGVGIVIAAARRVAQLGGPRRTLRVVLFANEEFGSHGAKAYAAAHAHEAARHVLVMEADSGGGPAYRLDAGVAAADWPWARQLATELGLEPGTNGKAGGVDVAPMRALGAPELIATQDDTHYFDVHHTPADTVDTLDRAGMSQAAGIFAALAHAASEGGPLGRLPPPGVAVTKPGPVNSVARLGWRAPVALADGLVLELVGVKEDSRCPLDVQCVWAGRATVAIAVTEGAAAPRRVELTLPGPAATLGHRSLRLTALEPLPVSGRRTLESELVATVAIGPAQGLR
jgi:carboxypeptidase Q